MMTTRFDLIFAWAVVAALAAGCATSSTRGTGDDAGKEAAANPGNDRAVGLKRTITDPNAIRDMVRQPGQQVGRTM